MSPATLLTRWLPRARKQRLKAWLKRVELFAVQRLFAYSPVELERALGRLGVNEGDTLLVHAAFDPLNGFRGEPADLIGALVDVLGDKGNLLMMSMPYAGTTREYMGRAKPFDVRRAVSRMGIVTEVFRRRSDVVRSLSPTHPLLARGPQAQTIIADHDANQHACGLGSPFERFHELGGKVLFHGVPFNTFTFVHYLEDRFRDSLPFALYGDEAMTKTVVDAEGASREVRAHVFSDEAIRWRNIVPLAAELDASGALAKTRIGRTDLLLVATRDAVAATERMIADGRGLYPTPD